MRFCSAVLAFCSLLLCARAEAGEKSARELYDALNALRIDAATTYQVQDVNRIELRRGDVQLSFDEGKLAFFASFDGRITGAVFSGRGHALAFPRGLVEKQQMAYFLGPPVLDQSFTNAWMRFTDDSSDELLHEIRAAHLSPAPDPVFASRWDALLTASNPNQSLRILFDKLTNDPRPYFYAGIESVAKGFFDVLLDYRREEQMLIGQPRVSGSGSNYDVWASYSIPGYAAPAADFRALSYAIDTSILPDSTLDAKADVRLRALKSGGRLLIFQLSPSLSVQAITGDQGEALTYFQNEGMNPRRRALQGSYYLYVLLPTAPQSGAEFTLHFRYRGNVIQDAGNGVLFVGARDCWYPHFGDTADFADYDLSFRWPRRLRLVATGAKLGEREDGDFRVARWKTEKPISVAGFNLGEYLSASLNSKTYSIEVYANRQLEKSLRDRLALNESSPGALPLVPFAIPSTGARRDVPDLEPSPADSLKALGKQIDASIAYYEAFSGPFPFQKLSVSQIPGTFGQGWPGLLYLSTFSFLQPFEQQRAGLSEKAQEHFTELVPFHEVAHQWWGNLVGWGSYRDQWIDEAIANYLAVLFADSQKNPDRTLRVWLERYRQQLVQKAPGDEIPAGEIGALELGNRLNSSKSNDGFDKLIYPKGTWVVHMLREMLREPDKPNPDARFTALLRTLIGKYAYRSLSTEELQKEVEAIMTPNMDVEGGHSMEWFFDEWVRGTGIPRYRVEFSVHHAGKNYTVSGKLLQENVPDSFVASVPLYASTATGRSALLGTIVASGPETSFHFRTQSPPHKIVIDPRMTVLCTTEQRTAQQSPPQDSGF